MRLTAHAEQQRRARKLGLGDLEEALRDPECAWESRENCYVFIKHVDTRYGRRRVKVVFKLDDDLDARVVTVGDDKEFPHERPGIQVHDMILELARLST